MNLIISELLKDYPNLSLQFQLFIPGGSAAGEESRANPAQTGGERQLSSA
jgi:hypothetical protein